MMTIYGNSVDSVQSQEAARNRELEDAYKFNIAGQERAAQQQAAYAFQRRALEDADMSRAVNYQNQFNRDAFNLGEQRQIAADQKALQQYQFGVQRKRDEDARAFRDKEFEFNREAILKGEREAQEEIENVGESIADSLSLLRPAYQKAVDEQKLADTALRAVKREAMLAGFTLDPRTKAFTGTGANLGDVNARYLDSKEAYDAAKNNLAATIQGLATQERQARGSGMVVEPTGMTHAKSGKWYPFKVQNPLESVAQRNTGRDAAAPEGLSEDALADWSEARERIRLRPDKRDFYLRLLRANGITTQGL